MQMYHGPLCSHADKFFMQEISLAITVSPPIAIRVQPGRGRSGERAGFWEHGKAYANEIVFNSSYMDLDLACPG